MLFAVSILHLLATKPKRNTSPITNSLSHIQTLHSAYFSSCCCNNTRFGFDNFSEWSYRNVLPLLDNALRFRFAGATPTFLKVNTNQELDSYLIRNHWLCFRNCYEYSCVDKTKLIIRYPNLPLLQYNLYNKTLLSTKQLDICH